MEEVWPKDGEAHQVHRTSLRTELGVFSDPSASDLPPGYSICPPFVKDIPYDWVLNYHLTPDLRSKALEQLYKPFLPPASSHH